MIKIFQSTIEKGKGDCTRAVMASLFDEELENMPLFAPDSGQGLEVMKYFDSKGYDCCFIDQNKGVDELIRIAKFDGGVGGYFYASVPSKTFENGSHAVIVDTDLNVVHDPNPNQLALETKKEEIHGIYVVTDFTIEIDGTIKR